MSLMSSIQNSLDTMPAVARASVVKYSTCDIFLATSRSKIVSPDRGSAVMISILLKLGAGANKAIS